MTSLSLMFLSGTLFTIGLLLLTIGLIFHFSSRTVGGLTFFRILSFGGSIYYTRNK